MVQHKLSSQTRRYEITVITQKRQHIKDKLMGSHKRIQNYKKKEGREEGGKKIVLY